jgi:hypothetical protein
MDKFQTLLVTPVTFKYLIIIIVITLLIIWQVNKYYFDYNINKNKKQNTSQLPPTMPPDSSSYGNAQGSGAINDGPPAS